MEKNYNNILNKYYLFKKLIIILKIIIYSWIFFILKIIILK